MFFLSFALIGGGCIQSGYGINHLDIGARYAGVLMAITNTAATIPGIVSPYVVGLLTNKKVQSTFVTRNKILSIKLVLLGTTFKDDFLCNDRYTESCLV